MKYFILFLIVVAQVHARIGETPEEMEARYGAGVTSSFNGEAWLEYHGEDHLIVTAQFLNGKVGCQVYHYARSVNKDQAKYRSPGDTRPFERGLLTDEEKRNVIAANGDGMTWEGKGILRTPMGAGPVLKRDDGKVYHVLIGGKSPCVFSSEWLELKLKETKEQEKKRVEEQPEPSKNF